ncbi:hypothetical protein YPPY13_3129 [Yersinia pestis PY-13]|nr:hypothetical protein YPPY13_3129 [Yersinia pestis PY-13]EIR63524.1 hypothetical protein YPPY25_3128 [Yersinia pestis PY-25]EIS22130.1 hypothetical protein YPPY54_3211 [Yersinia pestis PY-54]EIT25554.1 hypothetical protein YPPY95_3119 [Yersinia pestis PY-95]EIT58111.1 hypothetical protein YPPY113_3235 [Yersinia pestis PY-113]
MTVFIFFLRYTLFFYQELFLRLPKLLLLKNTTSGGIS